MQASLFKEKQIILRPYQKQASDIATYHLKNGSKPFVMCLSVGAGKSIIIADICSKIDEPILILQPSKELLEQNFAKLKSYGITDISKYSASVGEKVISKYTYATIGSIYKKPDEFKHFKYVLLDECHFLNPKNLDGMYRKFFDTIKPRSICGLTATPYRMDMAWHSNGNGTFDVSTSVKMINRIKPFFFKSIAYLKEMKELQEEGYLAPIKYITSPDDWSELKLNTTGADFDPQSLNVYANKTERIKHILNTMVNCNKMNENALIFAANTTQGKKLYEYATELIPECSIAYLDSDTKSKERDKIVSDFKSGKIQFLINYGILTTGFDAPNLKAIILARPTMSVPLYYQIVGRVVRLDPNDPNKVAKLYDMCGMVERFGKVEDIKLAKEDDGFRDKLVTLVEGSPMNLTGYAISEFTTKKKKEKMDTNMEYNQLKKIGELNERFKES